MKFLLIITFTGILAAEVCASSFEENSIGLLTDKEKIRVQLKNQLQQVKPLFAFGCACPLSLKETVFAENKLDEFIRCGNATVDIFTDKLDDDVYFDQIESIGEAVRMYATPVCEIYNDLFRCLGGLNSAIDLCLLESDKLLKNKLFAIVPLIHQAVCLRNGNLIADIVEHDDGIRCLMIAFDAVSEIQYDELFKSNSIELFGDGRVCKRVNTVIREIYQKVGECSAGVLDMVKVMIGHFYERTQCIRYIHDFQCY